MRRRVSKMPAGPGQSLYKVRYESDECEALSPTARSEQVKLIQDLGSNPDLLNCGLARFEKLSMHHDGSRWVVEMDAVAAE